jgi:hypothetical protein
MQILLIRDTGCARPNPRITSAVRGEKRRDEGSARLQAASRAQAEPANIELPVGNGVLRIIGEQNAAGSSLCFPFRTHVQNRQ